MAAGLLRPEDVAIELAMSRRAVLEELRAGRLAGLKLRRQWRIRPEDLAAYQTAALARERLARAQHFAPLAALAAPSRRRSAPELNLPGADYFLRHKGGDSK